MAADGGWVFELRAYRASERQPRFTIAYGVTDVEIDDSVDPNLLLAGVLAYVCRKLMHELASSPRGLFELLRRGRDDGRST